LLAGKARWEHILFLVGVPLLAYFNEATKRLFVGLLPMGLLGLVYDAMRWVKDVGVTPDRVHLCDLRAIDAHIASVTVAGERGTVHDWVQAHPSLPLDLLCSIPYGTFIFFVVGFAVVLYVKDYARMRLFGWVFLAVNLAGFTTYHLYPAAPPWYFHAHGCTVDLAARSSEGVNLARVDAYLGIHYFRGFYGRASDVFGAMPSLHVSYPALVVLFGWPVLKWPGRVFTIGFACAMCFAAVYLDHHWIIDVILGLAYALAIYALAVLAVRAWAWRRDFASATSEIARETVP
jgi:membrane-associated phospholipid phosphatase